MAAAKKEANQRSLCRLEIKPWEADQDLKAEDAKIKATVLLRMGDDASRVPSRMPTTLLVDRGRSDDVQRSTVRVRSRRRRGRATRRPVEAAATTPTTTWKSASMDAIIEEHHR